MSIIVPSFVKISQRVSELLSGHDLHTEIYKTPLISINTVNGVTVLRIRNFISACNAHNEITIS